MEAELGLKITKTRDDIASICDFRFAIAKDRAGPFFFLSKETHDKFMLNAHLKGYKRENIAIKIGEDGSEIWVSGEKEVNEMTIVPSKNKNEELRVRGFKKKFKIPKGVVLDGIKASYNEEGWMLTIVMPKMMKGRICGVGIEEVNEDEEEEEEVDEGRTEEKAERGLTEEVKKEEEVDEKGKPEEGEEGRTEEEEEAERSLVKKHSGKPWKPCPTLLLGGSSFLLCAICLVICYIRLKKK